MRFVKLHGLGNDYLFLDAVEEPEIARRPDLGALTLAMCRRHEGVGADGVIVISRADIPGGDAVAMRILNADGSDGGMCGNGARCACKLAVERGYVRQGPKGEMRLCVNGRVLSARVLNPEASGRIDRVSINMGRPLLELAGVPVLAARLDPPAAGARPHEQSVAGVTGAFVNVGNPHFVVFTNADPEPLVERLGPALEKHPAFPERMNIQVVRPERTRLELRTWERGAGRTRACGTGACAAGIAGVLTGRCEPRVTVSMLGGELEIEWDRATGDVHMTGPAEESFRGEWSC